ncbi:YtxH domain-containing protein [Citricoccus nitrophenolicus]|uniref:YtxH domain-containing protein n=1 Tax=Citricoccus nitrophenolicus TaxID=863575 RepID=UPI0031E8E333
MKRLITLGIGAALGYLLGSREGRKNLDKFAKNAQGFWNDPKTQEQVQRATSTVKQQAPVVAEKAAGLADKATDAVKEKAPNLSEKADRANAAAHTATQKGSDATQGLADKASSAADKSTGKHATDGSNASSGNTNVKAPTGDVVSDPSQSLETEGGGPDRY